MMLRSVCSMLKPGVVNAVPNRGRRYGRILTWPIDYLPFKWTYPEKVSLIHNTGDLIDKIPDLDRSRPLPLYAELPEFKNAPEHIKRLFSLDFAPKQDINAVCLEDLAKLVRRHPGDTQSLEYKIAYRTYKIRLLRPNFQPVRKGSFSMKHQFNQHIQIRAKYLKMLGRLDQKRYQFVKDVLQIEHTPYPLGEGFKQLTRKGELRRLTKEWAENVKKEKMNAFRAELKEKQISFKFEKKETEEWIAKEIEALQLTDKELEELDIKNILQKCGFLWKT